MVLLEFTFSLSDNSKISIIITSFPKCPSKNQSQNYFIQLLEKSCRKESTKHPCFLDKNADHLTAEGKSASSSGNLGQTALKGFSQMPGTTQNFSTRGFLSWKYIYMATL